MKYRQPHPQDKNDRLYSLGEDRVSQSSWGRSFTAYPCARLAASIPVNKLPGDPV